MERGSGWGRADKAATPENPQATGEPATQLKRTPLARRERDTPFVRHAHSLMHIHIKRRARTLFTTVAGCHTRAGWGTHTRTPTSLTRKHQREPQTATGESLCLQMLHRPRTAHCGVEQYVKIQWTWCVGGHGIPGTPQGEATTANARAGPTDIFRCEFTSNPLLALLAA